MLRRRQPSTPAPRPKKRRVSRREIEARRQRWLRWGMIVAGALLVLILGGGALNEYIIKPNATLAKVGDAAISRQDYWRVRAVDLFEQANQYQQFASFVGPDQQQQYLQLAQSAMAQIPAVWGSTDTDPTTLSQMIDDQVYLQHAKDLGVEVTDQDAETYMLNRFAPPDAPLITPSPTPTFIPARAVMATETTVALMPTPTPRPGTPSASPAAATPLAATPLGAMPAPPVLGTPVATPLASPMATPQATPVPPGTPSPAEALATAEAGFTQFQQNFFGTAHLTRDDYLRLVAKPGVARQKVAAAIDAGIGQSADQVHAAHILVATKDLADQIYQRVTTGGEDFATVARETSTDEATAGNGGDLGWFTREEVVMPVADAAFGQNAGQISKPVESQYGWHVVKTIAKENDRPLTDAQITRIQQARLDAWLDAKRAESDISSSLGPTPTPAPGSFQPPADAPPPPTPTPLPPASPAASPVASPEASPPARGTPVAALWRRGRAG
jgi:parvulin-like peptidyl-prolyl isomerase